MEPDPRDTARALAALAGLPMTTQRLAALALALPLLTAGADALYAIEYGDAEPAPGFKPPKGASP